jgi:putative endonuclease
MIFFRRRQAETDSSFSGRWGEEAAARHLENKKYKILGRRVRIGRRDEIDLVARWGEVLIFVEVKTRRSVAFGRPADFVDRKKRHALSRAAVRYLERLRNPRVTFRFDVVEVVGAPGAEPEVRHIENAFQLDKRFMLPC